MGRDDEPFFDGPRLEMAVGLGHLYKTPFPRLDRGAEKALRLSPSLWISMMQDMCRPLQALVHPWMPDLQLPTTT